MNDEKQLSLRLILLIALRESRSFGLPQSQILTAARIGGHQQLTLPELLAALRDLADARCVAPFEPISGPRWRITEMGVSQLLESGL